MQSFDDISCCSPSPDAVSYPLSSFSPPLTSYLYPLPLPPRLPPYPPYLPYPLPLPPCLPSYMCKTYIRQPPQSSCGLSSSRSSVHSSHSESRDCVLTTLDRPRTTSVSAGGTNKQAWLQVNQQKRKLIFNLLIKP